jgi:hypothetical protein
MSFTLHHILGAVVIGIGASVLMDVWNLILKRVVGIPSLNYCLLGRWLLHMQDGTFSHMSISASPQRRFECSAGWLAHYSIGVAFALVFLALQSDDWLAHPTLLPALLYGIATVVFPFFILQPSFGLGIRHCFLKNAQTSAGQTEKPDDTYSIRGRALCMCTRSELCAADSCLTCQKNRDIESFKEGNPSAGRLFHRSGESRTNLQDDYSMKYPILRGSIS